MSDIPTLIAAKNYQGLVECCEQLEIQVKYQTFFYLYKQFIFANLEGYRARLIVMLVLVKFIPSSWLLVY